jgi:hypothetical protein
MARHRRHTNGIWGHTAAQRMASTISVGSPFMILVVLAYLFFLLCVYSVVSAGL